jgi:N-acetylglutamate synthase
VTTSAEVGMVELERLAALGWQGTSIEPLGDWLLRAGAGFTGRANSVLPLGSPGCRPDDALARVAEFYHSHRLPPQFQVPLGPETSALDGDLDRRGWSAVNPSWVLVADLAASLARCRTRPDLPAATFEPTPSAQWLAGYLYRGSPLPDSAVAVLRNAAPVVFGSLSDSSGQLAVVRGVLTEGWLGVTALTVAQDRHRTGAGSHLMAELMRWAMTHGARQVYLQVAAENEAALGLYERLCFVRHHAYHYRRSPN